MKFRRSLVLSAVAALTLVGLHAPSMAQQRLRVAGNFPADHTATKVMEIFKKEVEARTKGELQVDLFPNMQLGGAAENVDQVRSGTVFAIVTSIAYFTRIVPEYEAVSLPFLFSSREAAFRVMDGPVGKLFDERMAQKGFISLGYGELGFRHVTNNVRPITSSADFKGLKIRLQPNEVHLDTFRALGANPVAMDVKEVYSAMQQGVLDGHENPYNIIASRRFNEVQKHLSDTGHFYDFINAAANKRLFERLSKPQQEAVMASMKEAMTWQRAEAAREDERWRQQLVKAGMTFTPITPQGRADFRRSTAGVVESLKKRIDPKLIEAVVTEATK
ncbi:MAG: TRAP transporter substrate-binding protein [Comamonadaceae bacterium]|jgi:tripartite ATP-independent transporter DctP family solute receptor|uniref:TRAP transporter substrate-binding protein n=1 Tax=Hydrogenophaga borbori TaxID=2294117 RepID=A0A372EJI7_9BURK|nr:MULTISPECIES: TRAP transporter substrate-binding protein [Hydrogenophaga]NCT98141.1 TRAP transporter substrate-binding protein [Comamonadaceae bacterium]RFP78816.1 TRAP transporter substrate-binding protein [Hydrogenophaga borbori]WQB83758.1 TRAP transporter substrate-binding protein [Hydrogenophaga sp. SNF1]